MKQEKKVAEEEYRNCSEAFYTARKKEIEERETADEQTQKLNEENVFKCYSALVKADKARLQKQENAKSSEGEVVVDVIEAPMPDGTTIAIPQYKEKKPTTTLADGLFDKVKAALTRGGEQEDSFPKLAPKWNCSQEQCALMMAELKIARIETGKEVEDSYVDAIGYLVLAYGKHLTEKK